ncbi:MAG TPA: hypothetical protein VFZ64_17425 [Nocardioidaceae bacterium]
MRLLSGSVMTRRDHRVASAWPGAWAGITISATRVVTENAGKGCARRLAQEAKALCDFPVIVIYDPPPYVHVGDEKGARVYDAPQHVVCMWPADSDPHRFLERVLPTFEEPTSEYGFIHHFFDHTTWEKGLDELEDAADRQSDVYRVNWH